MKTLQFDHQCFSSSSDCAPPTTLGAGKTRHLATLPQRELIEPSIPQGEASNHPRKEYLLGKVKKANKQKLMYARLEKLSSSSLYFDDAAQHNVI
jgi:hypothetical protein